jgi:hypothetical protein
VKGEADGRSPVSLEPRRKLTSAVVTAALVSLSLAGLVRTQPVLARTTHEVKERDDTFVFPPPAELHAGTLGYDAAVVDLLWADLLVEHGTHYSEKRDFTDIPKYLDAILELEPTYAPLYKYVTSMLAYRPMQGTEEDVRKARAYMERGTRERSTDAKVWMEYGEFIAFIAPSFLHDDNDKQAWRIDGARAMAHAVELGGEPDRALTAAAMLTRAGDTRGTIAFLRRAYALTEGPSTEEVHEKIGEHLAALQANSLREAADATFRAIEARRRKDSPGVDFGLYLLLGPSPDVFGCTGVDGYGGSDCDRPECCREWTDALRGSVSEPESSEDSP